MGNGYSRAVVLAAAFSAIGFMAEPAVAADVYVYRDAQGNRVYSDHPPAVPSEHIQIESDTKANANEQAQREARRAAQAKIITERAERDQARAAEEAAARKERAKRCREAQVDRARLLRDGPKYDIDSKGNRVYYSAEQITQARAEAARAIEANCRGT